MEQHQSTISLVKASLLASVVAVITLVLFILPAEYNIDPTGVGQKLGLTVFNEETTDSSIGKVSSGEQESVIVTVPVGRGVEYKLAMQQYQKVTYEWMTDNGALYVDLHGEPQGDTTGYFESYTIATSDSMKGSFTAPFAGSHGWYWKNNSDQDIQVQLIFSGDYVIEGLKQ
ncbi:MAG: hypothetical protein ACPGR2_05230 [Psychrobium sp.]